MSTIDVQTLVTGDDGSVFDVTVTDESGTGKHTVSLTTDLYTELSEANITPEEFIKTVFEFLLEREGKESILQSFDVRDVEKYFPEFKEEIRKRVASGRRD